MSMKFKQYIKECTIVRCVIGLISYAFALGQKMKLYKDCNFFQKCSFKFNRQSLLTNQHNLAAAFLIFSATKKLFAVNFYITSLSYYEFFIINIAILSVIFYRISPKNHALCFFTDIFFLLFMHRINLTSLY